jgi:hypothetical protein
LRVPPNMFLLHLDNNTQIRDGASHYRFLDILKNLHFTQTWGSEPSWFSVWRQNGWELGAVLGICCSPVARVATPWTGIGTNRGLTRNNRIKFVFQKL